MSEQHEIQRTVIVNFLGTANSERMSTIAARKWEILPSKSRRVLVDCGCLVRLTDEIGDAAAECVHPIKDFHETLLHFLGLDDNKLTYFHQGRFKQLSQTPVEVIKELI